MTNLAKKFHKIDDEIQISNNALNGLDIAIILPAYNEELTIAQTIKDFYTHLPSAHIWIINNRSTDKTEHIAKQTLVELQAFGGVIYEKKPGKGNAVRRAFRDVEADIYVMADADCTYPANELENLIKPIFLNHADMVVGDRHSNGSYAEENKRQLHQFGNGFVKGLVNLLFNAQLVDIMSGYRVFTKQFVKTYPILVEGFELETDMTLHALDKGFNIVEVPVSYKDRPDGSVSKLHTIRDGIKVITTIANILRYYRPLTFFSFISVILALLGILSAVPVISDWILYQYIYHVPLAILATGLEVSAFTFLAIGLILDSIKHQNKQNFEHRIMHWEK